MILYRGQNSTSLIEGAKIPLPQQLAGVNDSQCSQEAQSIFYNLRDHFMMKGIKFLLIGHIIIIIILMVNHCPALN